MGSRLVAGAPDVRTAGRERPSPPRGVPRRPQGGASPASASLASIVVAVAPPLWAELLADALEAIPGFEIGACVADEPALLAAVAAAASPVILLDYEAWGPGTESVIARLRRESAGARILVLARRASQDVVVSILRAGATGLVGKDRPFATVVAALRAVAAGEAWANRTATASALHQLARPDRAAGAGRSLLTRRELDVLDSVCDGLRNREIASALGISEKTVKTHLASLFLKAGVSSRLALARWARQEDAAGAT